MVFRRWWKIIELLKSRKNKKIKKEWLVICTDSKNNKKIKIKANYSIYVADSKHTILTRSNGIKNNIGNSLQMHPTIKIIAQFDKAN